MWHLYYDYIPTHIYMIRECYPFVKDYLLLYRFKQNLKQIQATLGA